MRYNPPPSWPEPPEGWVPPPGWSPDPSWPPPPPDWQFWVEDVAVAQKKKPALDRVQRTGDDVEYFGDDRAWSSDSDQAPPGGQINAGSPPSPSSRPIQVAPEDLSAHHLGRPATIKWDDEQQYAIGTLVAVTADSTAISVKLAGLETPVSFLREVSGHGPDNPRLHVWM
jgi:hypothetical protein